MRVCVKLFGTRSSNKYFNIFASMFASKLNLLRIILIFLLVLLLLFRRKESKNSNEEVSMCRLIRFPPSIEKLLLCGS